MMTFDVYYVSIKIIEIYMYLNVEILLILKLNVTMRMILYRISS